MVDQHGNIFKSITERWNFERDDIETIEEVGTKEATFDLGLERLVGGGDDTHIDRD
jgi:hypothetical protein